MTDEDLAKQLEVCRQSFSHTEYHDLLCAAVERIESLLPTPPPAGSVEVKLMIGIGKSGYVIARRLVPNYESSVIHEVRSTFGEETTHEGIATVHVPSCQVPEVVGTVEPVEAPCVD